MDTLGTILLTIHLTLATAFSIKNLLALPYLHSRRLWALAAKGDRRSQSLIAGPRWGRVLAAGLGWVIISVLGLLGAYAVAFKVDGYKRFFFAYSRKEMDNIVKQMTQ